MLITLTLLETMSGKWFFDQPDQSKGFRLILHPDLDECGNAQPLRFPPFHQELLTQNWWNAGENLGRIRVIISEGIVHADVTSLPFERLKNIVSFSFQHAPMGGSSVRRPDTPDTEHPEADEGCSCTGECWNCLAKSRYVVQCPARLV